MIDCCAFCFSKERALGRCDLVVSRVFERRVFDRSIYPYNEKEESEKAWRQ